VLFATLAGFSLMLIAGSLEPKTGLAGRQAKARIAIRAVMLVALGTALVLVYGDLVIIPFYGVYFLLALPLVRLRAGHSRSPRPRSCSHTARPCCWPARTR
jgi:uncharacterized protein